MSNLCLPPGTKNQGSLVQVKDLSRKEGVLVVTEIVLGICSNSGELKKRNYATGLYENVHLNRNEDELDED